MEPEGDRSGGNDSGRRMSTPAVQCSITRAGTQVEGADILSRRGYGVEGSLDSPDQILPRRLPLQRRDDRRGDHRDRPDRCADSWSEGLACADRAAPVRRRQSAQSRHPGRPFLASEPTTSTPRSPVALRRADRHPDRCVRAPGPYRRPPADHRRQPAAELPAARLGRFHVASRSTALLEPVHLQRYAAHGRLQCRRLLPAHRTVRHSPRPCRLGGDRDHLVLCHRHRDVRVPRARSSSRQWHAFSPPPPTRSRGRS